MKKSDGLKLAASMIVGAWYFGAIASPRGDRGPVPLQRYRNDSRTSAPSRRRMWASARSTPVPPRPTSASSVTLTCNKGVTVSNIVLDNGSNASGTQKRMKGLTTATDFLNYNIDIPTTAAFTCPAVGTGEWNATGITTASSLFTTTGGAKLIPICASIPSGQFPSGQTYQDTVNVTVTYN